MVKVYRLYFKCNYPGCDRRRLIELEARSGHSTETVMEELGEHNHPPLLLEGDPDPTPLPDPHAKPPSWIGAKSSPDGCVQPQEIMGRKDDCLNGYEDEAGGWPLKKRKREEEGVVGYEEAADDDSSISEDGHETSLAA